MESVLLPTLTKKEEIDRIINNTIDKVLVLRFGRTSDENCLLLDDIVCFLFSLHSLSSSSLIISNFSAREIGEGCIEIRYGSFGGR